MKPQKAPSDRDPQGVAHAESGGRDLSVNPLRKAVFAAILGLGWLAFAFLCAVTALEYAPGVEGWIARAVAERIDSPLGEEVRIDDVDVLWLERSLAIRGLEMGPADDANGEGVHAAEVRVRLGWSGRRGVFARRIEVTDGSVILSESLSSRMDRPAASDAPIEQSAIDLLAKSPDVSLRSIELGLAMNDGSLLELGTASVSLTQPTDASEGPEGLRIAGRWTPRLGAQVNQQLGSDLQPTGTVWLRGVVDHDRVAHIRGIAHGLRVSPGEWTGLGVPGVLTSLSPEAGLDLSCEATYQIGRSSLPKVQSKLRVSGGRLLLPWLESAATRPVEEIDLLAQVEFDPEGAGGALDPEAWSASGTLKLSWEDLRGQAGFRAGEAAPTGASLEVWVDLPNAPLGERLSELANGEKGIVEIDNMLAPKGSADVSIGVRIPRVRPTDRPLGQSLERLLLIRARGEASLAYHGGIDRRTGRRDIGFPLPVRRVVGDVTWSIRPGGTFPGQLAFYDMTGRQAGGPVDVQGSLHFTPIWRFENKELIDLVPTPFHLKVKSQRLPLDRDFEAALRGLYGVPEVAEIIPTWNPAEGTIDLDLELWRSIDRRELGVDLDTTLDGVSFRWRELPIPIDGASGRLRIRGDGGGPENGRSLVQIDLKATSPIARVPIEIRGRTVGAGAPRGNPQLLSWFEVESDQINAHSQELQDEVARKNPDAGATLESTGINGFVDLFLTAVKGIPAAEAAVLRGARSGVDPSASVDAPRPRPEDPYLGGTEIFAEVRPSAARGKLTVQPTQFPIITRDVSGRLLATAYLPPDVLPDPTTPEEPYVALGAGFQGQWQQVGPSVPIAVRLDSAGDQPGRLSTIGAGLDIGNRSLVGSLTRAANEASVGRGGIDPIDTDGVDVAGRVDFAAAFTLPESPGLPTTDSVIGVEARLDKLGVGGSQILRDVSAHFRLDDSTDQWIGDSIDARLGTTAIELSDLVFSTGDEGSTLSARLEASGLPIDEEHLSFFLDEETLRTVLDDLSARGTFDLEDAKLTVENHRDGSRFVELNGEMRVQDAYVDLGVPIEVGLVESMRLHLQHEGRELRARAAIGGLFGRIAGRRLENARMQMTYVGKRLVIEAFRGGFEGGELRALGSDLAPGADLFAIDLAAPFPFSLAAQMDSIDIGEFLRGVFDSNFANRGTMDLSMRLAGDFEHLTEMTGGGKISVRDSALWAIPVFQALSQSLGIDTTVLFREMLCNYSIRDGSLFIDGMRVDSDLLSLVGRGSLTFEGDVTSDLEVRYRLVDGLGPLTRLLYYIQNSLLRVSIRGTMDRPTVVLRGLISSLFAPSEERDRLPLPGFSERPARF